MADTNEYQYPELLPYTQQIADSIKNAMVVGKNENLFNGENRPAVYVGFTIYGGQTHIGWNTPTSAQAKVGEWQTPVLGGFGYSDYLKYIYVWQG